MKSDQIRGWSEGGAYPREGSLLEQGGRLSEFEVLSEVLNRAGALTGAGALNQGNTVFEQWKSEPQHDASLTGIGDTLSYGFSKTEFFNSTSING